ncbi:MAG TPA: acyltransferase [Nitrospinota bacterium]|nr:acyltransferase [Nitrospinota bacterium]|tara:strand:+ start:75174 stop:75911 length:738 start_codon:yes stop_codon:yes gene_type:complete
MSKELDIQIQKEQAKTGKSNFAKYQDLVTGSRSFWFLIKFEMITLLASRIPGTVGIFLRSLFYPMILGKVGRGVIFGVDVWFRHPKKIKIDDNSIIDDGVLLDAKGSGNKGITIAKNCYIGRASILSCKDGDITLHDYVNLSTWCNISSNSKVELGEKTLLGPYASVFATEHNFDKTSKPILDQGWSSKGVVIGNDCWIGAKATVLDGVTIGDGAVIGTAALVNSDLPPNVIAVGMPAKPLKQRG